jgi:hypothetical protein
MDSLSFNVRALYRDFLKGLWRDGVNLNILLNVASLGVLAIGGIAINVIIVYFRDAEALGA